MRGVYYVRNYQKMRSFYIVLNDSYTPLGTNIALAELTMPIESPQPL